MILRCTRRTSRENTWPGNSLKALLSYILRRSSTTMKKGGVDGCWHVALIAYLIVFVTTVALKNSGLIYVGFMEEYGIDRELASWPSSILGAAIHASGILVGPAQRWFCVYKMGVVGSVLVWTGMIASAFAPSITLATIMFGVHGFGVGMINVTLCITLLDYFDKYRGTASGIMFTGETTCALVFPRVLLLIKEAYNFRSVFFIYGAIALNTTALCVLLRRPPWINRKGNKKTGRLPETPGNITCDTPLSAWTPDAPKIPQHTDTRTSFWHIFTLFTKPGFYLICAVAVTVHYSQIMYLTSIVDFAIDKGASETQASTIIMYLSPADFVGRVLLPLLADRGYLSHNGLVMLCYLLLGTSMVLLAQVPTFGYLLLACAFIEVGIGCLLPMKVSLLAKYIEQRLYAAAYGFTGLVILPAFLCNPLLLGFFRDYLGAYDNLYRVVGAVNALMSIVFFLLICKERRSSHTSI